MKCKCGGDSAVTTTLKPVTGGVVRHRKCRVCGDRFHTMESIIESRGVGRPVTKIPQQPIYTPAQAAEIQAKKVNARRKGEDIQEKRHRRDRVSNYFIEDDFDGFI